MTDYEIRLEIIKSLLAAKSPATAQVDDFFLFATRIETFIKMGWLNEPPAARVASPEPDDASFEGAGASAEAKPDEPTAEDKVPAKRGRRAKVAESPAEAPKSTEKKLTYKDLAGSIIALVAKKGRPAGAKILAQFGVDTALELQQEQYAEAKELFDIALKE